MKKNVVKKVKKDYLLMTLLVISLVVLTLIAFISVGGEDPGINIEPLPDEGQIITTDVIISEVVSNNKGVYANSDGLVCDYIEIYNGSSKTKDLTGYGLSDKNNEIKWMFPKGTLIEPQSYLVVSLVGEEKDGLNANFKLSAKGKETVILTNSSKKIIDTLETVALAKNQSLARDKYGQWVVYEYATPGFENSSEGLKQYSASLVQDQAEVLVINEFLPNNKGNFINEYNQLVGYVEIKNVSNEIIDLSEYFLSNDENCPFKYQFNQIYLNPGEIYSLYATNETVDNKKVTGFSLSNKSGHLVLAKNGKIVQNVAYDNLTNGLGYIREADGTYKASNFLSMGYENTSEGVASFQSTYLQNKEELIINEVMNCNHTVLAQNSNNYYDWIELYNNSNHSINLSEYCLTTDDNSLMAYNLPNVTLEAGKYYVIMCSGDTNLTNKSYYHANFKISEYEAIYLTKNETIVDCIFVANVPIDYSYGRNQVDGYYYMSKPTPNKANEAGKRVVTEMPVFVKTAGIYNNVEQVEVKIEAEGTIYYTTDGSTPTTSSRKYTGPLLLNKTTVIKAKAVVNNQVDSQVATASYIINENHTLPVLSVSVNPNSFATIHEHTAFTIEKQAYAEFWEESGSFSLGCSISLVGGNSRDHEKKSYCLRFDSDWGPSDLVYPLFDSRDNVVFDSLVLRSGSNDWKRTIFRDAMCTSLVDEYTDLDCQAYKFFILYVNGVYYGIYNFREKTNANFIQMHYNIPKSSVNLFRIDGELTSGSANDYRQVVNYAKTHNLAYDEYYEYVASKIDMQNLIDYWICEMIPNNPDVKNIKFFSSPYLDDGKWKYIYYDLDFAFRRENVAVNYYTQYLTNPNGVTGFIENTYDNTLPRKLFANEKFKQLFLERLNYHLHNTFSKENMSQRLAEMVALLENEIERDRNRWSEATMYYYNSNIKQIEYFIENREKYILKYTKSFFNLTDAQMKEIFSDLW